MAQLWNKIKSFLGFKKKEETVMVGSFKPVEPKGWDSVENAVQTDPERVPGRLIAKDHVKMKRKRRLISKESRRKNRS